MPYSYTFLDAAPAGYTPVLISGNESLSLNYKKFLLVEGSDKAMVFEVRYPYHCSPFSEAILTDNILAVGFEGFFYLYDITASYSLLRLEMEGYFGYLYSHNRRFFVTCAYGIHCIDRLGNIIWENDGLGIDGVIIHTFEDKTINGEGEFDPPGGWVPFKLDLDTGIKL